MCVFTKINYPRHQEKKTGKFLFKQRGGHKSDESSIGNHFFSNDLQVERKMYYIASIFSLTEWLY